MNPTEKPFGPLEFFYANKWRTVITYCNCVCIWDSLNDKRATSCDDERKIRPIIYNEKYDTAEINTHIPLKQWNWRAMLNFYTSIYYQGPVNFYDFLWLKLCVPFKDIVDEYKYYAPRQDSSLGTRLLNVILTILLDPVTTWFSSCTE